MITKLDCPNSLCIGRLDDLNIGDSLEIRGINQGLSKKDKEEGRRSLQSTVNYYSRKNFIIGKYNVSVLNNGEVYVLIRRAA